MPSKGLRERILEAKTHDAIAKLLAEGMDDYRWASDKTKRRWKRAVKRRRQEIIDGVPPGGEIIA